MDHLLGFNIKSLVCQLDWEIVLIVLYALLQ